MLIESIELILHVETVVRFFEWELFGKFLVYFFVLFAFEIGFELVM